MAKTDDSETVKMKIENEKKLKKQTKLMKSEVNQHVDLKQAVKAVEALQKFVNAKKVTFKGLLDEDDQFI
jgi:hypothetical protein